MNSVAILVPLSLLLSTAFAAAPAPTAVDCSTVVIAMVDCLSFVSENSTVTKPAGTCCSGFKSVMKANPNCICEAFKNSAQLGVSLNLTKAMTLPAICHVASPLDNCHVSHLPVAPALSPKPASGKPTTTAGPIEVAPAPAPKKNSASGLTTSIGSLLAIAIVLISFT